MTSQLVFVKECAPAIWFRGWSREVVVQLRFRRFWRFRGVSLCARAWLLGRRRVRSRDIFRQDFFETWHMDPLPSTGSAKEKCDVHEWIRN